MDKQHNFELGGALGREVLIGTLSVLLCYKTTTILDGFKLQSLRCLCQLFACFIFKTLEIIITVFLVLLVLHSLISLLFYSAIFSLSFHVPCSFFFLIMFPWIWLKFTSLLSSPLSPLWKLFLFRLVFFHIPFSGVFVSSRGGLMLIRGTK